MGANSPAEDTVLGTGHVGSRQVPPGDGRAGVSRGPAAGRESCGHPRLGVSGLDA